MSFTRKRSRRHVTALLSLWAFLAFAPCALAADPDGLDDTGDGWRKVIAYARCALNIAVAVTPPQWAAALLDCGRLYVNEPPMGG